MEITYKTEISELLNVGEVSSKVGVINDSINEYSDIVDSSLRNECSSHLSEETFYINNEPIIFDKLNSLILSTEIDTSALNNIITLAQKKREEELKRLYDAVSDYLNQLNSTKEDKSIERANLKFFNVFNNNADRIAALTDEINALEKEIEFYNNKLRDIEGEMGGI